ncbi:MAG: helix-turn-helix transcriptional regulator [Burkholderiaceae bacterium]
MPERSEETGNPAGAPPPESTLATPGHPSRPSPDGDADSLPAWIDPLLAHLYDGVLSPTGFQRFVQTLVDCMDCKSAILFTVHGPTQALKMMWVHGIEDEWLQRYALDIGRDDIFVQLLLAPPRRGFLASNLDLPPAGIDFERSRFFREWLAPQGVRTAAGTLVLAENDWITQLVVQRSDAQPPFRPIELDWMDRLLSHLQRALRMRQRLGELEHGQSLLAGGLEIPAAPTLLLDEQNLVTYVNQRAAALLAEADSPLRLDRGMLVARERDVHLRLQFAIGNAIRISRGEDLPLEEVLRLPRSGRAALSLLISPLRSPPQAPAWPHGAALVYVFDPERLPSLPADRVRRMFGLTAAEAQLAVALCRGATLDEIAVEREVSSHTIRTQLKSLFGRTGTNRQTELVARLMASPAYFVGG